MAQLICVIRSMMADNINHTGANLQMNTGEQALSRSSLGSWLTYGLGSENANLPGFIVLALLPHPCVKIAFFEILCGQDRRKSFSIGGV